MEKQHDTAITKMDIIILDCSKWREIAILSVPGKIMASIMLNRMKETVDSILIKNRLAFLKDA